MVPAISVRHNAQKGLSGIAVVPEGDNEINPVQTDQDLSGLLNGSTNARH